MTVSPDYRPLSTDEINALIAQGCSSAPHAAGQDSFQGVEVAAQGFDVAAVRQVYFEGSVRIGTGAQIRAAHLFDCTIGDLACISNIGVQLAHYDIAEQATIENVGSMTTHPGATFGNGVEIEVLNEGGGREVTLFNQLDAQFAHMLCLHRYRPKLIEQLKAIAVAQVEHVRSDRGSVGQGAKICSVVKIIDMNIGAHAVIEGAASLCNGTILSSREAPTLVGTAVQADNFIIAEGSEVSGGAIISSCYVGQGCRIGKQFSAEASLFFANCEALHGEACSVFAGPYTVTHHKSTLLIAAQFSFFNAGSGTNQSNHMYKLGPLHEGKLERGTKTGSFSYMMWPCRVGPFSVVLGKHKRNFDTAEFPFSMIDATPQGRCALIPGLNLSTVGTVRDAAKWPTRDRRKGQIKRDRISFDVFSPMTVGRMITASAKLEQLHQATPKTINTVTVNGAEIKRVLLRTGQKFYRTGIHMYLLDKVVSRVESAASPFNALASSPQAVYSEQWVDIGGQLMPYARLEKLWVKLESGSISDLTALNGELDTIMAAYDDDQWVWVKHAFKMVFDLDLDQADVAALEGIADDLLTIQSKFYKVILVDASKEFDELTRTGFGQDDVEQEVADFVAVRGECADNRFVKEIHETIAELEARVARFKAKLRS